MFDCRCALLVSLSRSRSRSLSVRVYLCVCFLHSICIIASAFVRSMFARMFTLSLFFLSVLPVLQFLPQYCAVTVFQNTDIMRKGEGTRAKRSARDIKRTESETEREQRIT